VQVLAQLDPDALRRVTQSCVDRDIDDFVACSDYGFRQWMELAERWSLRGPLIDRLAHARLLARDAVTADGMREHLNGQIWSTPAATAEELLRFLHGQAVQGRRIVAQLDVPSLAEACHTLRMRGAALVEIPTFRAIRSSQWMAVRRLADNAVKGLVDAIAITDPVSADHLMWQAAESSRLADLVVALQDSVELVCLGPLAAAPLVVHGLRPALPAYPFIEDTTGTVAELVSRRAVELSSGQRRLQIRGHAIVLDGQLHPLQPGPMHVLRALANAPGRVLSSAQIRDSVPSWENVDDHAIEMAVSRLRRTLPPGVSLQTFVRRGYGLALEPP
jgi:uroporphyrinogen-III synthase